jgi:hypothetical protein
MCTLILRFLKKTSLLKCEGSHPPTLHTHKNSKIHFEFFHKGKNVNSENKSVIVKLKSIETPFAK